MNPNLPPMICFRVTRYCNARCGFCLAPPDGAHPPATVLMQRLDWLAHQGVRIIHFCGGEPTIHPALPELLAHVESHGGGSRLTTNGIALPERLLPALRSARTQVKVSLHGDRAHHDALVGRIAFDLASEHLRCLLRAGIPASVQTTIVADGYWVLDWMADFCLAEHVRQLSILPFIPRGSGYRTQGEYGLTPQQRSALRESVRRKRRALQGRLDIRWLDFSARPLHVVEADGRVVLEGASESMDTLLCTIPADAVPRKRVAIQSSDRVMH
ncbi:pyrroloquinoline quinone biosynthesis protein PqqE [Caballeronia arationis]|jgi:MoaA/NifB/PqqE/SkfB family radical SAM enzyme|uniref:Radical SAM superfamily protein n=1 Tax=Caballeronia arationis TaxID=1777142 RepID=A0A7Z7IFS9_9BURK|nr:radical SAM protein [Caballeronia arationis]SAL02230.1 pyrroloquinoline quinone biosynthesis protein PqqE [Caballeronia arationis]SOE89346.1 Radical SAM superfamily protein [Caballeronia arationis]